MQALFLKLQPICMGLLTTHGLDCLVMSQCGRAEHTGLFALMLCDLLHRLEDIITHHKGQQGEVVVVSRRLGQVELRQLGHLARHIVVEEEQDHDDQRRDKAGSDILPADLAHILSCRPVCSSMLLSQYMKLSQSHNYNFAMLIPLSCSIHGALYTVHSLFSIHESDLAWCGCSP